MGNPLQRGPSARDVACQHHDEQAALLARIDEHTECMHSNMETSLGALAAIVEANTAALQQMVGKWAECYAILDRLEHWVASRDPHYPRDVLRVLPDVRSHVHDLRERGS